MSDANLVFMFDDNYVLIAFDAKSLSASKSVSASTINSNVNNHTAIYSKTMNRPMGLHKNYSEVKGRAMTRRKKREVNPRIVHIHKYVLF